jgi:hypothetical protein
MSAIREYVSAIPLKIRPLTKRLPELSREADQGQARSYRFSEVRCPQNPTDLVRGSSDVPIRPALR